MSKIISKLVLIFVLIALFSFCKSNEKSSQTNENNMVIKTNSLISLDYSETPEYKDFAEMAYQLAVNFKSKYDSILVTDTAQEPKKITVAIKKSYKGVADTQGSSIVISADWVKEHPKDYGCLIHEIAHVFQAYPEYKVWQTEGIADYVRWIVFEKMNYKDTPFSIGATDYNKGYKQTAGFFAWIENEIKPGFIKELSYNLWKNTYSDEDFKTITGKSLDELWALYLAVRQGK